MNELSKRHMHQPPKELVHTELLGSDDDLDGVEPNRAFNSIDVLALAHEIQLNQ